MSEDIVLKPEGLTKHYGGVHALKTRISTSKGRARRDHGRQRGGQIHLCAPDHRR